MNSSPSKTFYTRLVLYVIFALVIPLTYLSIRLELFVRRETISFWAVVVIAMFLIVPCVMIKYYLQGMKTRFSLLKQIIMGVIKVLIPLTILLVILVFIKTRLDWFESNINVLMECVGITIGLETIAIIINPLPKWCFDNNVEGLSEITGKLFKKEDNTKGE